MEKQKKKLTISGKPKKTFIGPQNFENKKKFNFSDKKFYKPDQDEITENPRSRSAKLRYIQRTDYLFRENLDIYSMTKYKRMLEELK